MTVSIIPTQNIRNSKVSPALRSIDFWSQPGQEFLLVLHTWLMHRHPNAQCRRSLLMQTRRSEAVWVTLNSSDKKWLSHWRYVVRSHCSRVTKILCHWRDSEKILIATGSGLANRFAHLIKVSLSEMNAFCRRILVMRKGRSEAKYHFTSVQKSYWVTVGILKTISSNVYSARQWGYLIYRFRYVSWVPSFSSLPFPFIRGRLSLEYPVLGCLYVQLSLSTM